MKKYLVSGFNTVQDVRLEAGTYTLVAYVKSMYSNVYTFALGDGENWTEYDMDVVKGQLCKVWLTFTIDEKVTKFKPIANNFSESLPVYVADLQLTRGNMPVEAGASPYDVGTAIDKAQADANVSLAKTAGFTKIGDVNFPEGLIFTSLIKLLDAGNDGDEMAGISGIAGDDKEDPAFWAGGSYDQAIGNTAKAIIRHDGSGHLAGGNISWDEEGNSLFTGSIQSSDEGNRIIIDAGDRSLKMINRFDKQLVNFHFYEGTDGSYPVLRMDSWLSDVLGDWSLNYFTEYSPFGINFRSWANNLPCDGQLNSHGMNISYGWQGTDSERSIRIELFDDQYLEMQMKGSVISNLSLKPKVILGSASVWLDHWDVFVTCYNSANINVYLPSSPSLGAIKFIRRMNASTVTVMGNGKQISHGNGSVSPSILSGGRGDTAVFFWDGQYWSYNYWVRDTN